MVGVPVEKMPNTPASGWARALMARMGGEDVRLYEHVWISFTVPLPDEPSGYPSAEPEDDRYSRSQPSAEVITDGRCR